MKMVQRKLRVIGAAVIYLVLIILFLIIDVRVGTTINCPSEDVCVRFCCQDEKNCNDKFIKKNFKGNITRYGQNEVEHTETLRKYRILHEAPACNKELVAPQDHWSFVGFGDIRIRPSRSIDDYSFYFTDEYCLVPSDVKPFAWSLLVCKTRSLVWTFLHFMLIANATALLAIGVFTYLYFKQLRTTNHGASVNFVLIGILFYFVSLLFLESHGTMMHKLTVFSGLSIGLVLSFLWMSILCFNLWCTIKDDRPTSSGNDRFKFYSFYAFGVAGLVAASLLGMLLMAPTLSGIVLFVFFTSVGIIVFTAFADVVLLILTAVKLFQIPKTLNIASRFWLEVQKNRFWMYLEAFAVLLITCPIEIYTLSLQDQHEYFIVSDLIKLFSACVIFAIFVLDEEVQWLIYKTMK